MKSYNVLVVDDEDFARRLVVNILDKSDGVYKVKKECFNGEMAFSEIKKGGIDIVISDIKMPFMDGIELLEKTLAFNPDIKFIMLTAYDDFELVRKCFMAGAVNYIMKTEIDKKTLLEILDKSVIGHESKDREKLSGLVENLVGNKIVNDETIKQIRKFGIDPVAANVRIIDLKICGFHRLIREKWHNDELMFSYGIRNILDEITESTYFSCVNYYRYNGEFVILVTGCNLYSDSGFMEFIRSVFLNLEKTTKNLYNIKLSMGISQQLFNNKTLNDLYHEAVCANEMNFFFKKNNYVFFNSVYLTSDKLTDITNIQKDMDRLTEGFLIDFSEFQLYDIQVKNDEINAANIKYIKQKFDKWYYVISDYVRTSDNNIKILNELSEYTDYLKTDGTFSEILGWINRIVGLLREKTGDSNAVVTKMKRYVAEHYSENFSLGDTASEIGMNKIYISRVFKRNTGMDFSEYLTNYRIERAVELIKTTNHNVSEISEKVGFSSIEGFSKAFKKIMGRSPKNYINVSKKKN